MLVYCDLHIHSCLSPCADDDMTPWNLAGMAKVKGLDVIALTDHNSARNTPEAIRAGQEYSVGVIPGMEVNTREEVHMLAYFPNVEAALAFDKIIYEGLPELSNRAILFGNQILIGEDDQPMGQLDKLLLNATRFSVDEVVAMAAELGGVCIPAHINRSANGMLGSLGMMPP
ncbi:MAG: PHP domain-containing protein, partial [Clostridia bacterium]|nr:PHP domain-containing protein [Clostridia bacterium]